MEGGVESVIVGKRRISVFVPTQLYCSWESVRHFVEYLAAPMRLLMPNLCLIVVARRPSWLHRFEFPGVGRHSAHCLVVSLSDVVHVVSWQLATKRPMREKKKSVRTSMPCSKEILCDASARPKTVNSSSPVQSSQRQGDFEECRECSVVCTLQEKLLAIRCRWVVL